MAARLAENPAFSVAVIEGGSFYEIDNGNHSQIPAAPPPYSSQPLLDWDIVTAPQTVCLEKLYSLFETTLVY